MCTCIKIKYVYLTCIQFTSRYISFMLMHKYILCTISQFVLANSFKMCLDFYFPGEVCIPVTSSFVYLKYLHVWNEQPHSHKLQRRLNPGFPHATPCSLWIQEECSKYRSSTPDWSTRHTYHQFQLVDRILVDTAAYLQVMSYKEYFVRIHVHMFLLPLIQRLYICTNIYCQHIG